MRNKAGKEQTIKSLTWAFNKIIQTRKWKHFSEVNIHKRMFETGVLEEGCFKLSEKNIDRCRIFASKLLMLAGLVFPKEGAAYDLQEKLEPKDLDFDEWENEFLDSLTMKNNFIIASNQKSINNWELRISQLRLSNKIGRKITSRYFTQFYQK